MVAAAAGQGDGGQDHPCRDLHVVSVPAVDFELTAEQREIQALARDFARAEIEPHASAWDRDHGFPRELIGSLASSG